MGRIPSPVARPDAPIYPTPRPADYSDEVSEADMEALRKAVADLDKEEWETVDGPAW